MASKSKFNVERLKQGIEYFMPLLRLIASTSKNKHAILVVAFLESVLAADDKDVQETVATFAAKGK